MSNVKFTIIWSCIVNVTRIPFTFSETIYCTLFPRQLNILTWSLDIRTTKAPISTAVKHVYFTPGFSNVSWVFSNHWWRTLLFHWCVYHLVEITTACITRGGPHCSLRRDETRKEWRQCYSEELRITGKGNNGSGPSECIQFPRVILQIAASH